MNAPQREAIQTSSSCPYYTYTYVLPLHKEFDFQVVSAGLFTLDNQCVF